MNFNKSPPNFFESRGIFFGLLKLQGGSIRFVFITGISKFNQLISQQK